MKTNILIKALCVLACGFGLTSCLEGDQMNTPPGGSPTLVEMSYVGAGGTLFNSGLEGRFFAAQALLMSPADATDTVTFAVTIQGPAVSQDVTINLQLEPERALDNLAGDHVEYTMMKANQYKFLSTSAVIPQGETFAEFQVVFYPPNIDFTESTILPVTATNDAGLTTSSNYGRLYFHVIGNAIAGLYNQQFIRVPDGGTSFPSKTAVFSPKDPTTISVTTGYYDGGPLLITFDDDGAGNLTNFKAVVDPVAVGVWKAASIEVTLDPTIEVNSDYTVFKVHYQVVGPSGGRDCTDIYTKK
ncbi:MAG TPA: DUF1735 domain-containing protein [Cyclobacteriaceae bacterium]|nr:DUF1735 domain-containing protein [Cyclobacteriaceae bacterium]